MLCAILKLTLTTTCCMIGSPHGALPPPPPSFKLPNEYIYIFMELRMEQHWCIPKQIVDTNVHYETSLRSS